MTERTDRGIDPFLYWADVNVRVIGDGTQVIWYAQRDGWGHLYLVRCHDRCPDPAADVWRLQRLADRPRRRGRALGGVHGGRPRTGPRSVPEPPLSSQPRRGRAGAADAGGRRPHRPVLTHGHALRRHLLPHRCPPSRTCARPPANWSWRSSGPTSRRCWRRVGPRRSDSPPRRVTASTDVYGVIVRPSGFDPGGCYPVIDYIYGGPQVNVAPTTFTDATPFTRSLPGRDAAPASGRPRRSPNSASWSSWSTASGCRAARGPTTTSATATSATPASPTTSRRSGNSATASPPSTSAGSGSTATRPAATPPPTPSWPTPTSTRSASPPPATTTTGSTRPAGSSAT